MLHFVAARAACRYLVNRFEGVPLKRHAELRLFTMRPDRKNDSALPYTSMSLEQIQEGVSAEAVSYAAGLLVEAIRNYESNSISARQLKLTLTEAQMIAANLIVNASSHLDDKTLEEQVARVRKAIKEVRP
jgi:hypothetical protein